MLPLILSRISASVSSATGCVRSVIARWKRSAASASPSRWAKSSLPPKLVRALRPLRTLSLSRGESTFLRGNMFYGKRQMFGPDFIAWLEGFRFPPYHLERRGENVNEFLPSLFPVLLLLFAAIGKLLAR